MFYVALLFLILLIAIALIVMVQNPATLLSSVHLTFLAWHLPGIPIFLLGLLGAFLGGLLLYVVSSFSARLDALEIKALRERVKELRARVVDLEKAQQRSPSGSLPANFVPPSIPIPGFAPSGSPGASGPLGPSGFSGSSAHLGQGQALPGTLPHFSPSASGSGLALPSRPLPPLPPSPDGGHSPFLSQS
ncbi:MAG TPA: hypothetical protein VKV19_05510 [Ktedonobacteraceae bacterium]|nr:hypothetical protein [Ktedonobacteraceae bacterium]